MHPEEGERLEGLALEHWQNALLLPPSLVGVSGHKWSGPLIPLESQRYRVSQGPPPALRTLGRVLLWGAALGTVRS